VLASADPRLDLTDTGLPIEEVRTRQSIAVTRSAQLLAASGREFELELRAIYSLKDQPSG